MIPSADAVSFQVVLFAVCAIAALGGTRALLNWLEARAILDTPNERSSHQTPTPKGGGIAVIAVILAAWIGLGLWTGAGATELLVVPAAAAGLAVLSWVDDLIDLGPLSRLAAQVFAVAFVLYLGPAPGPERGYYFQGLLPGPLDALAAGIAWVWFVNLFNFMDGIDGIAGIEAAAIGLGIAFVANAAGFGGAPLALYGLIVAGAAVGFLKWNWHPARIFLGDVGSVPLGFLLGWLLLELAAVSPRIEGAWAAAAILPAYYLADATTTLIRRGLRGDKVWQAHREHFYQRAVGRGLGHAAVSRSVLSVDSVLIVLAVLAVQGWAWPALIVAFGLSLWFLRHLAGAANQGGAG